MEPVKITNVETWSSIDIFLFSNGQQYSPPRKYHLRSEELQWWGATMSYLGRTHYGSGHSSIELYAVNGTKINGPLELINGAAYVAVEPPDSFINTGYEEYLLRASRSWEKRLTQKSYNTEAVNLDLSRVRSPTVLSNTDNVNTAENIVDTASMNGNAIISAQKTRPTKPYHRLQRKSITNPNQIQKKKSSETYGNLLKRNRAEIDKVFPCPKKTLNKNACKNLRASGIVVCKPNETIKRDSSSCCKKRHPIKPDSNPKTEASKDLNVNDTASVRRPLIIDLFKNDESDSISSKNDPGLYPIIDQSKHHNEKKNLTEDNVTVSNEFVHKTIDNQDFEKHSLSKLKPINEYEQCNMLPKNDYLKNDVERDLQDKIPVINNNNENKSNDHLINSKSEKQAVDEYVAHMNKGGLLLIKLKIKLKDCKTIFNRDKVKNLPTTSSLSNLPITDKTSQVDINISFSGELLKSNDQRNTQDKSLQSLLNKLYAEETKHINSKDPRIIILQCACRDYSNSHKCCMCNTIQGCETGDGQREEGLNRKLNETFTRCECHVEALRNSKHEGTSKNDIIVQTITDAGENTTSLSKNNGVRVKDLARKFEKSNGKISNSNNKQNSNETSINESQQQSVVLTRLISAPLFEMGTENPMKVENNIANTKRTRIKSTQTDWCNLLLEAKLQEADNYTFHLPPLHILKQCNL